MSWHSLAVAAATVILADGYFSGSPRQTHPAWAEYTVDPLGLVTAPSSLRYAILGDEHVEYDMACSFHSLVASILTSREAPTLHWIVNLLISGGERGKRTVYGGFQCVDPKRCVLSVYNYPEPQRPGSPSLRWASNNGAVSPPQWFIEFTHEIRAVRSRIKEVCYLLSYSSKEALTSPRNEFFHYISNIEARLMRGTLRRLRNSRGVFSHYLVHDGIFIDRAVDPGIIHDAFDNEARSLGLGLVRIVTKPWDKAKNEYHRLLRHYRYSHDMSIPIPQPHRRDLGTGELSSVKTVCVGKRRPCDTRGKVPKS